MYVVCLYIYIVCLFGGKVLSRTIEKFHTISSYSIYKYIHACMCAILKYVIRLIVVIPLGQLELFFNLSLSCACWHHTNMHWYLFLNHGFFSVTGICMLILCNIFTELMVTGYIWRCKFARDIECICTCILYTSTPIKHPTIREASGSRHHTGFSYIYTVMYIKMYIYEHYTHVYYALR